MSENWKPGDVAMRISPNDGPKYVATRVSCCLSARSSLKDQPHWHFVSESAQVPQCGGDRIATYRRAAVIDPEDREQVERLARASHDAIHKPGDFDSKTEMSRDVLTDLMRAALREFANPTPPRPDEPLGLGAVVEDAKGERWLRGGDKRGGPVWLHADGKAFSQHWKHLDVASVLSEGIS